ncbi:MAG: PQQ-binding-like beta-propeller repeat protein [Planctomycetes bacterium]|nr:PQQ-binding-like beta-propeller repeat protein [Planctomycetota bacterium]
MRVIVSVFTSLLLVAVVQAGDWPQWLGPKRDGSTKEEIHPWSRGPEVVWKQPVGDGYSSPVVAGGQVFIHGRVEDKDEEEVAAFDAKTGKPAWRNVYTRHAVTTDCGGYGPRATPCVADNLVYTHGISGVISCFETGSGKTLWQVDTHKEFKAPYLKFGVSSSLLVHEDKLIAQVGGPETAIIAFDRKSGKVLWKCRSDAAGYASPIALGEGGDAELVFLTGQSLVAVKADTGEPAWEYPIRDIIGLRAITPVRTGDAILTCSMLGAQAIRVTSTGGKKDAAVAWTAPGLTCYISTPLAVDDMLYAVTNSVFPKQTAALRCMDSRSGKELWRKDNIAKYHAGLVLTGNKKILMLEEEGDLVLLEPSRSVYQELSRSKVCGSTMAMPAIAEGLIYVRDTKEVTCLKLAK